MFDFLFAGAGLLLLSPLMLVISAWVRLDSPGPVFFRQVRVGRAGQLFRVFKFRTMVPDAERQGAQLTVGMDRRITECGHFLRRYKLDELPQLINVVTGDMSLVGPRPEVPRYVEQWPKKQRELILSVPPGITDFASIEYKDENELLAGAPDPEKVYVEQILPIKLEYYEKYVRERSLWLDIVLIFRTLKAVFL